AAGLVMAGAGLGASSTAIQVGGMEAVGAAASGAAAGLLATSRYVGGAAGSGALPLVMALVPEEPLNALFALAVAAGLPRAAAGASRRVPRRGPHHTQQRRGVGRPSTSSAGTTSPGQESVYPTEQAGQLQAPCRRSEQASR